MTQQNCSGADTSVSQLCFQSWFWTPPAPWAAQFPDQLWIYSKRRVLFTGACQPPSDFSTKRRKYNPAKNGWAYPSVECAPAEIYARDLRLYFISALRCSSPIFFYLLQSADHPISLTRDPEHFRVCTCRSWRHRYLYKSGF